MKKQRTSSIAAFVLGFIFLLLVGGVAFVFNSNLFEREAPQIVLPKEIEWNLKDPIKVQIADASGVRFVRASLFDGEKSVILETKEFKSAEKMVDLNLSFPKVGFGANKKVI